MKERLLLISGLALLCVAATMTTTYRGNFYGFHAVDSNGYSYVGQGPGGSTNMHIVSGLGSIVFDALSVSVASGTIHGNGTGISNVLSSVWTTNWAGLLSSNSYVGKFTGLGTGLTNASGIPYAVTNGSVAYATLATNAITATNWTGVTASNNYNGTFTGSGAGLTGIADTNFNASLYAASTNASIVNSLAVTGTTGDGYRLAVRGTSAQTNDVFQVQDNANGNLFGVSFSGNAGAKGSITATNGIVLRVKPSFYTNFTCTTNLQVYCCNGTNQLITLPDAANVPNVVYRLAITNGWAKVIITNATGAQTIRDGTSLSYTQIGIGNPAFFSDGAHWWPGSKTKLIIPNAQFSCLTNIPLTVGNSNYPVTFNSTDYNNSQGIALGAGLNGLASKIWITNAGQYEFLPSIVESFSAAHTIRYWFKSNGVNIANSTTPALGVATGTTRVITVPFTVNVTVPAAFEIWVESTDTGDSLIAGAASGNYPAAPSVICPVKRVSDTWP